MIVGRLLLGFGNGPISGESALVHAEELGPHLMLQANGKNKLRYTAITPIYCEYSKIACS